MEIITMTGSEKQINWATDIITAPYKKLEGLAKSDERFIELDGGKLETERAPLLRQAMAEYQNQYNAIAEQYLRKASVVIDKRASFTTMAKAIVTKLFTEAGKADLIREVLYNL